MGGTRAPCFVDAHDRDVTDANDVVEDRGPGGAPCSGFEDDLRALPNRPAQEIHLQVLFVLQGEA